ncbi:MAG: hypothetical protein NDF51_00690 [archaeon YNP-WB-040]|nr:hypothetical protein [Candidatus Culexarchaeum yellowstonense]
MSVLYRRHIPLAITFICGLIILLQFFLVPTKITEPWQSTVQYYGVTLTNWANLLANFIIGFGVVNISLIHVRRIMRAKSATEKFYSAWLLFVMVVFIVVGLFGYTRMWWTPLKDNWDWLQLYVLTPLDSTVYASLVFYMASGCYRAFRARNLESAVLLVVGFLSIMYKTPLFQAYAPWVIRTVDWIAAYPAVGAYRGIQVNAALGAILLGIRTLMGVETGYLGRRD